MSISHANYNFKMLCFIWSTISALVMFPMKEHLYMEECLAKTNQGI
jgi:hypothetical protein